MIRLHDLTVKEILIASKKAKNKMPGYGKCEICGKYEWLEPHEPIGNKGRRRLSIYFGLKLEICNSCHRELTLNPKLNEPYQVQMQQKFMREYPQYNFRDFFGRNYL